MADTRKTVKADAMAQQMGIDWSKIDFEKILQVISVLVTLFQQPKAQQKAALTAAGVQAEHHDTCCQCIEAAALALESARCSMECCDTLSNGE